MHPRIFIATGGSGGHVIPAETLAQKLVEQNCQVVILGHNVESNAFFSHDQIEKMNVCSSPLSISRFISFVTKTMQGIRTSYKYLKLHKPDCVVGFGSYHSFPVLCAAFILKIPVALYEANTVMGKVIKLFSKKAVLVASPFDFYQDLMNFTQVEPLIKFKQITVSKSSVLNDYGLDEDKKVLLILGGSQGANFLNQEGLGYIIRSFELSMWQVLHLAGHKSNIASIRAFYEKAGFKSCVLPFETNMQKAYLIADLVVSRSGATTLFELAHYRKPALLVPFPKAAEDHQLLNADHFVKHYPAAIIEEFLMDKVDIKQIVDRLVMNENNFKDNTYFINHTTLDKKVIELCLKK